MRFGLRSTPRRLPLALLAGVLAYLALASPAQATFAWARYVGTWTSIPDFSVLTPSSSGMTPTIGPGGGGVGGDYGLVFTNTINVTTKNPIKRSIRAG